MSLSRTAQHLAVRIYYTIRARGESRGVSWLLYMHAYTRDLRVMYARGALLSYSTVTRTYTHTHTHKHTGIINPLHHLWRWRRWRRCGGAWYDVQVMHTKRDGETRARLTWPRLAHTLSLCLSLAPARYSCCSGAEVVQYLGARRRRRWRREERRDGEDWGEQQRVARARGGSTGGV